MTTRALATFVLANFLGSCLSLAVPVVRQSGKVGVIDVSIPPNRNDDQYYTVSLSKQIRFPV